MPTASSSFGITNPSTPTKPAFLRSSNGSKLTGPLSKLDELLEDRLFFSFQLNAYLLFTAKEPLGQK